MGHEVLGGLAMLTISVPPMLVLAVDRLHRQTSEHPAMRGFVRGLGLAVAGNILAVMVTLCNTSGVDARSLLIVLKQRRNPRLGVVSPKRSRRCTRWRSTR